MKALSGKNRWRRVGRIAAVLAILLGVPAMGYCLWHPGSDVPLPDCPDNAIWIGHGWLGDDGWFRHNHRNPADFRRKEKITALFQKLRTNRISIVFPHLCPAQSNGAIAPYDDAQIERFLDLADREQIKVIPWIGGVWGISARPDDAAWRKAFTDSVAELLRRHPRLAGVQVNIEPLPSGNHDFLCLLEELRAVTKGKTLSVAAYPPPTGWQNNFHVHWKIHYLVLVSRLCDQMAVMMYDTSIPLEKCYVRQMTCWTQSLTGIVSERDCDLLLGIPAYEDAGTGYHRPRVENLSSALRGISAADRPLRHGGIAIYCEWEMNEAKWRVWRKFIR